MRANSCEIPSEKIRCISFSRFNVYGANSFRLWRKKMLKSFFFLVSFQTCCVVLTISFGDIEIVKLIKNIINNMRL